MSTEPLNGDQTPNVSKWSLSRLSGLAVLAVTLCAALGDLFSFFHLGAGGWFLAASGFIGSITERAQGGKGKLLAQLAEQTAQQAPAPAPQRSQRDPGAYGSKYDEWGRPRS